ncbi:general substrate transporter [Talaromyces proteolyticus]|uniref:General substrate transporter n=1 Tax=Talaromyces proteolyticus TaxID=1131652 RepID=A0AAD4Q3L3_9EURO|nr:general substrate transporter [Talaromyces proteolyticus]KAH8701901.1 general substrate transporter [Talaromyces proteolyticus]
MTSIRSQDLSTIFYYVLPIFITGFAYGWEVGSMGGILAMPQFLSYMNTPSPFRQGLMTVALIAGEFVGSLLIGLFFSDYFGRRITIMITVVLYLIGQVVVVAAQDQAMFIAGRVLNGFGAGPLFQTMSFYTAEIAPPHIRGRVTATLNLGIAVGILVAYWVQYAALNITGNGAWRLCFALQLLPGAIVGIIMLFRPESPRWLVQHDKQDQALEVLAKLHANGDTNDVLVRSELEEIRTVVNLEQSSTAPSYFTLLFGKAFRRRTALGMGIQCMQQLSGANIVLYYAAKVFSQTGRTGSNAALLANGISSALLVIGTFSLTLLLDYYGRRKPIFLGPAFMGVCLLVVASMLVRYGSPHFDQTTQAVEFTFANESAGNAAVTFMFLFQFFFGALSSSVPWTYMSEVFPVIARARGTSLATASNYFTNFWLGLYIPEALNSASWKLYYIFAGINFFCAIMGFLFFPETAGRTLEELDLLFVQGRSVFVFLDKDASTKRPMLQHSLDEDPESLAMELRKQLAKGSFPESVVREGDKEEAAVVHKE